MLKHRWQGTYMPAKQKACRQLERDTAHPQPFAPQLAQLSAASTTAYAATKTLE